MKKWSLGVLAAMVGLLVGCGGGGGSSEPVPPVPTNNVQAITVDGGPAGDQPNVAYVTVTVCAPGSTSNCQTIDHVMVDTGSTGLRIQSSVLPASLALPQQKDANGNAIVECAQFISEFTWGSVNMADVRIAGELASSVPVQVIGDSALPPIPQSCSSSGPPANSVDTMGAKGILGVGHTLQDCGQLCAKTAIPGGYYICPASSGCRPTAVAIDRQVQNPAAMFAADNNGVLIQLPAIPASGAATVTGSLIFGIGTQSNNALGSATVLGVDPDGNIRKTAFSDPNANP